MMRGIKEKGRPAEARFEFGKNWARFLALVDDGRIAAAEASLKDMLECESLEGRRFLDVGSGSGLFSLAARNLGATVHSFDYDKNSVGCALALRERYRPDDRSWTIEVGDALNERYLGRLGTFDVVYAWGVLHHTGDMWRALGDVARLVNGGGRLFVALYNDQRWVSDYWAKVKQLYNRGFFSRLVVIVSHSPYFLMRYLAKAILTSSSASRAAGWGMNPWRDVIDWLGGYPFQVARPEGVLDFYRKRGFALERMATVGGRHGCNEYIFRAPLADR